MRAIKETNWSDQISFQDIKHSVIACKENGNGNALHKIINNKFYCVWASVWRKQIDNTYIWVVSKQTEIQL